ncbi:MAG: DUF1573 domain-containing protein [Bacteroidaceae bacterium]|nr:DUF1573 domain-containing protein [Bacteroidaceae bacterium]
MSVSFFRSLAALLCCTIGLSAQTDDKKGPVLTFEETDFNLGVFDKEDAVHSHYFVFTNTGDENLVISDAYGSCSCTTVSECPRYPIAPGASDSIKVMYDGTTRRPGVFRRVVTLVFNSKIEEDRVVRVTITGEMVDTKPRSEQDNTSSSAEH